MLQFDADSHSYLLEGRLLVSVSSLVASQFHKFNARVVSGALARNKQSRYYGMQQDEIVHQWNESGRISRDAGIRLHHDIECYYVHGRLPENQETKEWQHFLAFKNDHPEWTCIANEWRVHNDKVAGTIDAVFDTPDGIVLVDWKRCKAIDYSGHGMGKELMKHVPDCNYSKYSLQLSLYRQLIKTEVADCYIVQLHPDLDTYQKIKAQNYYMEAAALLG